MNSKTALTLPRRARGYQSDAAKAQYHEDLAAFAEAIRGIQSTLDFKVSSRGWCYVLENEAGLKKGDFDKAQSLINDCRKSGLLPLDICAEDIGREFDGIESISTSTPAQYASGLMRSLQSAADRYTPRSFWEDQDCYLQLVVEKIDLKSLFAAICTEFHIPHANTRGWCDLHIRASMMRRFQAWEDKGKTCVLLYCGDLDPVGLHISDVLRKNMEDLSGAVGWHPHRLIIHRFGLNADWVEAQGLSWIEGLSTGSGLDLGDPDHHQSENAYVKEYIQRYGQRKVEANAMVIRPTESRALLRETIARYVDPDAPARYQTSLAPIRGEVQAEVLRQTQH